MKELENYLYFLKTIGNITPSTEEVYSREIYKFLNFLHKKKLQNVTDNDILKFVEHLKKYARPTARRKIAIIKSFFRHLEAQNKIESSPFNKIYRIIRPGNNVQHQQKSKPILTREQIVKLLTPQNLLSQMSFEELRNEVIVRLFLSTGIRREELLYLKATDIDLEEESLMVRPEIAKRRKGRVTFFDENTGQWLKWYLDRRKSYKRYYRQPALFITQTGRAIGLGTFRRIIETKFNKVGVGKKFRCHLFRHTWATMLLEGGADPKTIQDLIGHTRIQTTFDLYTHLSKEHLRGVYRKTNPFKNLK